MSGATEIYKCALRRSVPRPHGRPQAGLGALLLEVLQGDPADAAHWLRWAGPRRRRLPPDAPRRTQRSRTMAMTTPDQLRAAKALGGWIAHDGSRCPVAPEAIVQVRFRGFPNDRRINESAPGEARFWMVGTDWWAHKSPRRDNDIIAYRLTNTESSRG